MEDAGRTNGKNEVTDPFIINASETRDNASSRRFLVIKMEHGQADSLMDELPDSRLSQ